MSGDTTSWGRYPSAAHHDRRLVSDRHTSLPVARTPLLAFGNGRSYGDSCQNDGGTLLLTRGLDRFIHFDRETGILRCEAGMLFDDILRLVVPAGWFLPVTPGTRFVTLGGAIANDVHGKNHHRAGSFGCHVRALELLRSDGHRVPCTPTQNTELFAATIGGLGLTGLITWAEVQLTRIPSPWIAVETLRFAGLDAFFEINAASADQFDFTVAWIDCLAPARQRGRGLYSRGDFCSGLAQGPRAPRRTLGVPFTPPFPVVGGPGLKWFNRAYYHRPVKRHAVSHYQPFFYPLDGITDWNRLYGPHGFVQHQCVLPNVDAEATLRELLDLIAASGTGSFLAVLKSFGERRSPGLLSFPRPGVTLALDFPFRGQATLDLLTRLDDIVAGAGGALYPAKDARMSGLHFRQFFPAWEAFSHLIDPAFSSSFWRRVTADIH